MAKAKVTKTKSKKLPTKKAAPKKAVRAGKPAPKFAKSVAKPKPRKVAPAQATRAQRKSDGVPEKLRDAALKILDARQAEDIVTIDLTQRSSIADYLVVASGRASRQIAAIAHYLSEAFENLGIKPVRIEGLPEANWVLVDAGDVIVHLFRPEVRSYYNLETMWSGNGGRDKS